MSAQITKATWLNDTEVCQIGQLVEISGLSMEEIMDLIDSGVIAPATPATQPPTFQLQYIVTVKLARRLRDDFTLDRHGLALALTLLRRIEALEARLTLAHAHLVGR